MRCRHCRREVLWGEQFCSHCGRHLRAFLPTGALYLTFTATILTLVMIGLTDYYWAQRRPPNPSEMPYLSKPLRDVRAFLLASLGTDSDFRLEPRGNFNLQIYIEKRSLDALAQCRRTEFMGGILSVWCQDIPDSAFLPFVQIREMPAGDEAATGRCGLSHSRSFGQRAE